MSKGTITIGHFGLMTVPTMTVSGYKIDLRGNVALNTVDAYITPETHRDPMFQDDVIVSFLISFRNGSVAKTDDLVISLDKVSKKMNGLFEKAVKIAVDNIDRDRFPDTVCEKMNELMTTDCQPRVLKVNEYVCFLSMNLRDIIKMSLIETNLIHVATEKYLYTFSRKDGYLGRTYR